MAWLWVCSGPAPGSEIALPAFRLRFVCVSPAVGGAISLVFARGVLVFPRFNLVFRLVKLVFVFSLFKFLVFPRLSTRYNQLSL